MKKTFEKHHYGEWATGNAGLGGFAKLQIGEKDIHTTCKRCGIMVKMQAGQTTMKFWVGKWATKRPPCEPKQT